VCLIVDKNAAHKFTQSPVGKEITLLVAEIDKKKIKIATGGRNRIELVDTKIRDWIVERVRRGDVRFYPDTLIANEEMRVVALGMCTSDDPHVIALANISGAKLLFTFDKALQVDFKAMASGRTYNRVSHKHLIRKVQPCK
jgi:hypothetical protein